MRAVKIIAVLLVVAVFIGLIIAIEDTWKEYEMQAKVKSIDAESQEITCIDPNGNTWKFCDTSRQYKIGESVNLQIRTNGTPFISDDTVRTVDGVKVK